MPNFTKICCSAVLATVSFSCASPGGPPLHEVAPEINGTLQPVRRTLAPGDKLQVAFAPGDLADWTHEVSVRPDGYAAFLSIDEMNVFGLTPEELRGQLTVAYGRVVDRRRYSRSAHGAATSPRR